MIHLALYVFILRCLCSFQGISAGSLIHGCVRDVAGGIDFGIISQHVSLLFCEAIINLCLLNLQQQVLETFLKR